MEHEHTAIKPIVLIGVKHTKEMLSKVKKQLSEVAEKGKTLGIESGIESNVEVIDYLVRKGVEKNYADHFVKNFYAYRQSFFEEISKYAKQLGMNVVNIDSKIAHEYTFRDTAKILLNLQGKKSNLLKTLFAGSKLAVANLKQETLCELLVKRRSNLMVSRIKKRQPDIVVVGELHALDIEKGIPVSKRFFVPSSNRFVAREIKFLPLGPKEFIEATRKIKKIVLKKVKRFHLPK